MTTYHVEDSPDFGDADEPVAPAAGFDETQVSGFDESQLGDAPPKGHRAQWLDVLGDIAPAMVRGTANMALAFPENVANLAGVIPAGIAANAIGRPDLMPEPFTPATLDQYVPDSMPALKRVMQGPPENMDRGQKMAHAAGEFGTLVALTPSRAITEAPSMLNALYQTGKNAMYGAASGAGSEATENPYVNLAASLAAPVGVAGASKGVGALGSKLTDFGARLTSGFDPSMDRLVQKYLGEIMSGRSGDEVERVASTLLDGRPALPGMKPTTADVIAQRERGNSGPLIDTSLIQLERSVPKEGLLGAYKDQDATMIDALTGMAKGTTRAERRQAAKLLEDQRKTATEPLFSRAMERADAGATVLPGLEAQSAALDASSTAALQQKGQLRTLAANELNSIEPRGRLTPYDRPDLGVSGEVESSRGPVLRGLLADAPAADVTRSGLLGPREMTVPPPGIGMGGGAVPPGILPPTTVRAGARNIAGQVPEQRTPNPSLLNQNEGAVAQRLANAESAKAAAEDFAAARRGTLKQKDAIDKEIARMAFDGLKPLKADSVTNAVDRMREVPTNKADPDIRSILDDVAEQIRVNTRPGDGTIHPDALATIRARGNKLINERLSKEPKWDDKKAAGVVGQLKGVIDDAIVGAGGDTWKQALETHGAYSDAIAAQRVRDGLLNAGRKKGKMTPAMFLERTDEEGDGAAKFMKKRGVEVEKPLAEVIGPEDYETIQGIRRQLLGRETANDIATKAGQLTPSTGSMSKAEQLPFGLSSAGIAAANYALRAGSGKAGARVMRELDRVLQDPGEVAERLRRLKMKNRKTLLEHLASVPPGPRGLLGAEAFTWDPNDPYGTAHTENY